MKIKTTHLPLSTRKNLSVAADMLRAPLPESPAVFAAFAPAVKAMPPAVPFNALQSRIAELETALALANQKAHENASRAWLEAEARIKAERESTAEMKARQMRLHYLAEKSAVRDNTLTETGPQVVVTPSAVSLKLALDPRMAVPLKLPLLQRLRHWLQSQS